ncbi:DUF2971 domain-containing protein [Marinobacter alexandrii]|jgi:hypothetical protein|uniref:DUF2971 domain-containing protein n=1 Tax=Marinobacter alexandrii TaxID=2570351 RepID=UPI002ABD97C0|nr:DUF2971 domain-containing protein [Marinobacter alexandrii]
METLDEFRLCHPYVDSITTPRLYRFKSIRGSEDQHLEDFFLRGKLYHPTPFQLNDPFECRPHFVRPVGQLDNLTLRKHLAHLLRSEQGLSRPESSKLAHKLLHDPKALTGVVIRGAATTYGALRLCCFTNSKDNLLLWAHYGDSHKGMCLEFDSALQPISYARKVVYQDKYPTAQFPASNDDRVIKPALIKSKNWAYEEEYRIIFTPDCGVRAPNDGKSLYLEPSALTAIYFGACATESEKDRILQFVDRGIFNPMIYDSQLAVSTFSLQFKARP